MAIRGITQTTVTVASPLDPGRGPGGASGLAAAARFVILAPMRHTPPKPAEPRPGLYRHYKDNPYRVHGLALHTETREWMVVYEALYGDGGMFVRPAAMFVETVEIGGRAVPRFARVGE